LIFYLVRHNVTFKHSVFHLWQTSFASYDPLSTGSHVRGLFLWLRMLLQQT